MNILILNFYDKTRIVYEYYPEGKSDNGLVEYMYETEKINILKKAENDETGFYARKTTSKMLEFVADKHSFPKEYMQAWG
jgi:hypothetical protein